ncbi:MAG: radical SAM protein [Gammaproteobacteria bacterium]|jgi:hypothetical protein
MSVPDRATAPTPGQEELLALYLPRMRQRFKAEVNRLTSGAMRKMLEGDARADDLAFLMSYLCAWHWLRDNVHENYRAQVLAAFRNPAQQFLMRLLLSKSPQEFVSGYIAHWMSQPPGGPVQQRQLLRLLAAEDRDPDRLAASIMAAWKSLGLFTQEIRLAYGDLARRERERYNKMLGPEDQERLALVDRLPDPAPGQMRFAKLGLIPAMGCPQTCRHCMFIWRPPKPKQSDPDALYRLVDSMTDSVLFTGGDLTNHLEHFTNAIRAMPQIRNFAILLNGDFASDMPTTVRTIKAMADAVRSRPSSWTPAKVLLQISFDEFHQEVHVNRKGQLEERIPVAKIANIVEAAPRFGKQVQLALLHKQTALNFSMDVLHKGVFARLVKALGSRGHQVRVLSSAPSARMKQNPAAPGKLAPILKDASFVLAKHPDVPILMTSSTIDGYGRAELLDEGETVKEKELLAEVLGGRETGERFDIDLMFWFNGWATLFNAVHICLGNLDEDGAQRILERQRKDPLSHALNRFDTRLLELYAEVRPDLEQHIDQATGPHHLFHMLTEDPQVRLHMTRRLIASRGLVRIPVQPASGAGRDNC